MNPQRLTVVGYGRFDRVDLEIPLGCVALTGANGAGKSRLLNAIELALFAGRGELAQWLAPDADRLEITLEFEHAERLFRVRRGYRNGKTTVDLESYDHVEGRWEPETRETAAATQEHLCRLLGLSRKVFRASAFLAQGDAAAFPEADRAERKALLGEILDPHELWPTLARQAHADAADTDREIAACDALIAQAQQQLLRRPEVEIGLAAVQASEQAAAEKVRLAETELQQARARQQQNAAGAERVRTLTAQHAAADQQHLAALAALADATAAAEKTRLCTLELDHLADSDTTELEQELTEALAEAGARAEYERLLGERDRLRVESDARLGKEVALRDQAAEVLAHVGHAACDRCGQTLGAEAAARAAASFNTDADRLNDEMRDLDAQADKLCEPLAAAAARVDQLAGARPEPEIRADIAAARAAAERRAALTAQLDQLAPAAERVDDIRIGLAEADSDLAAAQEALAQAAATVADQTSLDVAVSAAIGTVSQRRGRLDDTRAELARRQHELDQLHDAETALAELAVQHDGLHGRLDLLHLAQRAYGRDGVPALIAENVAIPAIETEANRLLGLMPTVDGTTLQLQLRTQREKKTGGLAETLDILVADADSEREYGTYSGGERARLNICLRIALARLLAHRRGAESRLLAVDELDGLDAIGQQQLIDVLHSVAGDFDRVLVVSHAPGVRDAFDATVELRKDAGVSRIAGAVEAVPA